ncbi:hypothetical protein KSP39_PZI006864 [Platanthera zijinensis]|uniref:BTB domain-containing protein n=1 Tax=Platanthera zijinensis TaxID=2320716 RepID=A0AAP0BRR9_9ASPA
MISPATLLTQEHPLQDHLRNQHSDNDRSSGQLRALNCNLTSLYDHIQMEGFHSGAFSDIIIEVMGSTYRLHRLILSRSSYFRNMLYGPWKEAVAPKFVLKTDDPYVSSDAITMALKYLYGYYPKLNDDNAFRVLAAASFLDLQDLCVICTDFIIFELRTSNFLTYQVFAESQEYGIHGERVRNACWRYLCQCGTIELKEVSDILFYYVLNAYKKLCYQHPMLIEPRIRFLALFGLWRHTIAVEEGILNIQLIKRPVTMDRQGKKNTDRVQFCHWRERFFIIKAMLLSKAPGHEACLQTVNSAIRRMLDNKDPFTAHRGMASRKRNQIPGLVAILAFSNAILLGGIDTGGLMDDPKLRTEEGNGGGGSGSTERNGEGTWSGAGVAAAGGGGGGEETTAMEVAPGRVLPKLSSQTLHALLTSDEFWVPNEEKRFELALFTLLAKGTPSEEDDNNLIYKTGDFVVDFHADVPYSYPNCNEANRIDLGRFNMPSLWGGRTVGRRKVKSAKVNCGLSSEEYDAFHNVFEGGSLLYCNMSFEALLNVRKQLEELGFPCRSVNDGLWVQTLLCQKVQEIATDTSSSCRHTSNFCTCRQPYEYGHGCNTLGYYRQDHDRSSSSGIIGNIHIAESQSEGHGIAGPVRVHVRGPIDGLAGIGRGPTYPPGSAWPPTRYVFSRVPFGLGNRNGQQTLVNDGSEARVDLGGEQSGDGLTALVNHSQGSNPVHVHTEQTEGIYEANLQGRFAGSASHTSSIGFPVQMLGSEEQALGIDCESSDGSIVLDRKTPLRDIPPFRFGYSSFPSTEFEEVHRLIDGQVKHSPEVFYAGSFWKLSAQAFNDEDPHGRRTLGLFIHRRKAEVADSLRKVHMYVDSREKVTARYQLICPSKKEVMVFGSFKQEGTLLPKAPKGWGWRAALFFDELDDLLQRGALRVAAIVQLV